MGLALGEIQVVFGHDLRQLLEGDFRGPAQFLPSLAGITQQVIHFGGAIEAGVDLHIVMPVEFQVPEDLVQKLGDTEAGIMPKLFFHARCARLIECLSTLQHDPHRPEDVLKVDTDEDGNGGDDPADALRYLVMAMSQPSLLLPKSFKSAHFHCSPIIL